MLVFQPHKRYTAKECLMHPYFDGLRDQDFDNVNHLPCDWAFDDIELDKELIQKLIYQESLKFNPDPENEEINVDNNVENNINTEHQDKAENCENSNKIEVSDKLEKAERIDIITINNIDNNSNIDKESMNINNANELIENKCNHLNSNNKVRNEDSKVNNEEVTKFGCKNKF